MTEVCPRCKEHFCRLYFGAVQDDGSYICYDCHCKEMYDKNNLPESDAVLHKCVDCESDV